MAAAAREGNRNKILSTTYTGVVDVTCKQAAQVGQQGPRKFHMFDSRGTRRRVLVAVQGFASAAVGECYEIWLCVDLRQQTARRDASATARRTSPSLPPRQLAREIQIGPTGLFLFVGRLQNLVRISSAAFDTLLASVGTPPLTLYLLSPAYRPIQVTRELLGSPERVGGQDCDGGGKSPRRSFPAFRARRLRPHNACRVGT